MTKKILVIENDIENSVRIKNQLSKAKFVVDTANSAKDGIQKSQSEHFDLVLLDPNMPDAIGLKIGNHLEQPFIIMVNEKVRDISGLVISSGASYYIKRPFKIFEVLRIIQKAIKENAVDPTIKLKQVTENIISKPNVKTENYLKKQDNILLAVGCLIGSHNISQNEAYSLLEEEAKQNKASIELIASHIIQKFESGTTTLELHKTND